MRRLNEQEKRDALNEVLIELSKSQDILRESRDRASFFVRLESIYYNCEEENFRHFYSDIFSTLTLIDGDSSIGSLDVLAQNIQAIKDGYIPKNNDDSGTTIDISKEIVKLYDHTNLDIARINYTKTMTDETKSELAKNKLLVEELEQKVRTSEETLKKVSEETIEEANKISDQVQEKQKDMQKEYITILGIFASIVLAFTGGMTFSSSVLENMHKSSIYRVMIMAFIIGFVFINLIWLLMDFVKTINGTGVRRWKWLISIDVMITILILMSILACKVDFFKNENMITFDHYNDEVTISNKESIQ